MEFRLLGPLDVVEGDRLLAIGGGKQRSLSAFVLQHANEVVSCDRLVAAGDPERSLKVLCVRAPIRHVPLEP
jgi:hypothetical protein